MINRDAYQIYTLDAAGNVDKIINEFDICDHSFGAYLDLHWDEISLIKDLMYDEDDVHNIYEDTINDKNKENKIMGTSNLFNFDFGPVSSNQFRMSPYGLAVCTQANGWVAYNVKTGDLMDVDILNFDISKIIYKMLWLLSSPAISSCMVISLCSCARWLLTTTLFVSSITPMLP